MKKRVKNMKIKRRDIGMEVREGEREIRKKKTATAKQLVCINNLHNDAYMTQQHFTPKRKEINNNLLCV
jgi:hypothetical protein